MSQPIRVVDVVITETSADAETPIVYSYPIPAGHLDNPLAVQYVQIELTSTAAEGARCLDPSHLPDATFNRVQVFGKGTYRTDVEAFAA